MELHVVTVAVWRYLARVVSMDSMREWRLGLSQCSPLSVTWPVLMCTPDSLSQTQWNTAVWRSPTGGLWTLKVSVQPNSAQVALSAHGPVTRLAKGMTRIARVSKVSIEVHRETGSSACLPSCLGPSLFCWLYILYHSNLWYWYDAEEKLWWDVSLFLAPSFSTPILVCFFLSSLMLQTYSLLTDIALQTDLCLLCLSGCIIILNSEKPKACLFLWALVMGSHCRSGCGATSLWRTLWQNGKRTSVSWCWGCSASMWTCRLPSSQQKGCRWDTHQQTAHKRRSSSSEMIHRDWARRRGGRVDCASLQHLSGVLIY